MHSTKQVCVVTHWKMWQNLIQVVVVEVEEDPPQEVEVEDHLVEVVLQEEEVEM